MHGIVFDDESRTEAERIARHTNGVKQVIDNLRTQTAKWREEEARINDTLALNGFNDLDIRVIGNTAYLSGTVTGQAEEQRALRVIASISNLRVVNFSRWVPGSLF